MPSSLRVIVHRGSHQVGGSCIELATDSHRILIDAGAPLNDSTSPELPPIVGVSMPGQPPDAVLLSHAHTDHSGLLGSVPRDVPVYLTSGTSKMLLAGDGKVRHVPFTHLDHINVCRERAVSLSPGDRLQLKANSASTDGKLANGEVVTIAQIKSSGAIRLADGRVLPPHYRQFLRGYAVTSYGSQGKTVDHVLFSDSAIRAATNAQQWYVTISRGRKSIQIFTPDKDQLQQAIIRSGERELALDVLCARGQQRSLNRT